MRLIFLCLTAWLTFTYSPLVQAQTSFGEGAEEFRELFDHLQERLEHARLNRKVTLGGQERQQFVSWIRDHVHVMKAMKYFHPDIHSFWEFFMERQTYEGIYFDYYFPIDHHLNHRMNLFDQRYWRIFSHEKLQMHRLPVEADLEYLMVEGAYYIWQANGDNSYINQWMDKLELGLKYNMRDPLRWSDQFQLIKRGYTLDTWDFMQLPSSREAYTQAGGDVQKGIFNIDENTPMGIMHGDNSGLYAACMQLSMMHSSLGDAEKTDIWAHQAAIIRLRTNALCWNGRHYAHFVIDDPMPDYLSIDQENTLSLSNTYSINRGLPTHEMAVSIIDTYHSLIGNNSLNSFAEWFGIYPPVEPHFADYKPGSYMNGGVNTIVGGELAKAALQNGREAYGVDILLRIYELVKLHDGDLPVAYQPDGKVDEGIPDNWGQAAVMSALIEGLAGVVDQGQLFESVELSPRWHAAGKKEVSIMVAYPASQKHVSYQYRESTSANTIELDFAGDPTSYKIRMLLPEGMHAKSVTLDGQPLAFEVETIASSHYVVIDNIPEGNHKAVFRLE